ncbi:MAG: dimeric dUTPase (all-alpha-NTP-PPase superfamily) [Cognaticolwellia sp.]|jgi:dimeric dUTPase (all-alpha-NTP-PPase superfamily)
MITEDMQADFIDAVKFGDLAKVTACFKYTELELNQTTEDGHTVFELALACGFKNITQVLLDDQRFASNAKENNPLKMAVH